MGGGLNALFSLKKEIAVSVNDFEVKVKCVICSLQGEYRNIVVKKFNVFALPNSCIL